MTLVVNMADPLTDVRANSRLELQQMQDAAREQLAEVQRKAAERQRLVEAEQAKLMQARAAKEKADAEHRAKLAKQAAMPARRLPPQAKEICQNIASRAVKSVVAVKPKGSTAAVDPKATASVKPKGSTAAVDPKATASVKPKGSVAAVVDPKATASVKPKSWINVLSVGQPPKATAVKAKGMQALGGRYSGQRTGVQVPSAPRQGSAQAKAAGLKPVVLSSSLVDKPSTKVWEPRTAVDKAAAGMTVAKACSQILTPVKTFLYTLLSLDILSLDILSLGILSLGILSLDILSIEGFVFRHVVFR